MAAAVAAAAALLENSVDGATPLVPRRCAGRNWRGNFAEDVDPGALPRRAAGRNWRGIAAVGGRQASVPERAAELGCEPGMSSQYSCLARCGLSDPARPSSSSAGSPSGSNWREVCSDSSSFFGGSRLSPRTSRPNSSAVGSRPRRNDRHDSSLTLASRPCSSATDTRSGSDQREVRSDFPTHLFAGESVCGSSSVGSRPGVGAAVFRATQEKYATAMSIVASGADVRWEAACWRGHGEGGCADMLSDGKPALGSRLVEDDPGSPSAGLSLSSPPPLQLRPSARACP